MVLYGKIRVIRVWTWVWTAPSPECFKTMFFKGRIDRFWQLVWSPTLVAPPDLGLDVGLDVVLYGKIRVIQVWTWFCMAK